MIEYLTVPDVIKLRVSSFGTLSISDYHHGAKDLQCE